MQNTILELKQLGFHSVVTAIQLDNGFADLVSKLDNADLKRLEHQISIAEGDLLLAILEGEDTLNNKQAFEACVIGAAKRYFA